MSNASNREQMPSHGAATVEPVRVDQELYQAGIRCDAPGCAGAIWRVGRSRAMATSLTLEAAHTAGWSLQPDRLAGDADFCADHAKAAPR